MLEQLIMYSANLQLQFLFLLLCHQLCFVFVGKPQRTNGKVHGKVHVGNSPTPVDFTSNDLHSYVVVNDGRSYVAISDIPNTLGPSLLPLTTLGGVIGWAFALEQPGSKNGFSIIGEGKISTTALITSDDGTSSDFAFSGFSGFSWLENVK